jgi:hypothetical protein
VKGDRLEVGRKSGSQEVGKMGRAGRGIGLVRDPRMTG